MANINEPAQLLNLSSKPPQLYESMPLTDLVAYCMYWLKVWGVRQTIEAISVCAWRLFPAKFSMVGFAEFPDAFRVNRSLLQGQPKYRNFLSGSAKNGFSLNARGLEIAERLEGVLGPPGLIGEEVPQRQLPTRQEKITGRSVEPAAEIQAVRAGKLFGKWKTGELAQRDLIHLHSMLGVFDHTPAKVRHRKYRELVEAANALNDTEVLSFLKDLSQEFPGYVK